MNEIETRLRAALAEQAGLLQSVIDRALNLAAELAVARAKIAELEIKSEVKE